MKNAFFSVSDLLSLYVGSYLLVIERGEGTAFTTKGCVTFVFPGFRCGGKTAEFVYSPVFWLDQQVRQGYWSGTSESDAVPVKSDNLEAP